MVINTLCVIIGLMETHTITNSIHIHYNIVVDWLIIFTTNV